VPLTTAVSMNPSGTMDALPYPPVAEPTARGTPAKTTAVIPATHGVGAVERIRILIRFIHMGTIGHQAAPMPLVHFASCAMMSAGTKVLSWMTSGTERRDDTEVTSPCSAGSDNK